MQITDVDARRMGSELNSFEMRQGTVAELFDSDPRGSFIMSGTAAVSLDPSQAAAEVRQEESTRRLSSKIGIDATRKHKYPPLALPPKEHLDRVREHWKEYGFRE